MSFRVGFCSASLSVVALVVGCGSGGERVTGGDASPVSVSTGGGSSSSVTVVPPPERHPDPDYFVDELDEAVAGVVGRRFVYDAGRSLNAEGGVIVRVFQDAPPDEIITDAAVTAVEAIDDYWVPSPPSSVAVDVVRCPFTVAEWETIDVYLRSLTWRDPDKQFSGDTLLNDVVRAPVLAFFPEPLPEFVHCQVLFGVIDVTSSEVARIREVASANNVSWMDFALTSQAIGSPAFDDPPRDPPPGFLPHIELPWYCSPPGCTGHEEELD